MARGKGAGGSRTPANPAAVSGPGALSRRTDGGPGQPIRSFPAEFQGQRAQLEGLQSAAPMAAGGGGIPSGGGGPGQPPVAISPNGILGESQRPWEPSTAGIEGPRAIPDDPDILLRAIYRMYPHPDILRLLPDGG